MNSDCHQNFLIRLAETTLFPKSPMILPASYRQMNEPLTLMPQYLTYQRLHYELNYCYSS